MGLLDGRRAIITGGGHPDGIGQATARLMVSEGAQVAVLDRSFWTKTLPVGQTAIPADVADADACHKAVKAAAEALGGIDIVVNNAGIVAPTRIADLTAAEFARMLEVNLVGAFNVTQAGFPYLQASSGAAIVNIASIAAQRGGGLIGGSHYAASKGGVISFTKATAREWGCFGIRANAVAPGIIDNTSMTAGKYDAERRKAVTEAIPLGRFGTPDDVARVVLFLASPLAGYLTGTLIDVNGGFHMH